MDDFLRFYIEQQGKSIGPFTDDEVRHAIIEGSISLDALARLAGSTFTAPVQAWAALAGRRNLVALPKAPDETAIQQKLPSELSLLSSATTDMLLFHLHEAGQTFGPLTGEQIRRAFAVGRYKDASASLVGTSVWYPVGLLIEPTSYQPRTPRVHQLTIRCPICRELIALGVETCPECGENTRIAAQEAQAASSSSSSTGSTNSGRPSIPDDQPGQSWLRMHWRPLVTLGAIAGIVCTGVVLRYLAPGRFTTPYALPVPAAATQPGCSVPCWNGEACQLGECVWQKPNDVGHINADVRITGPFSLPKDVSDILPLDTEYFFVSILTGIEIRSIRTGELLGFIGEAPQVRRLYRVGDVVYATSPQRIYVLDIKTTRVLKTIETGSPVGEVIAGASGRRVLASLPQAHAVAVIATEYHSEIDRIQFGDDAVGPVGCDDTGKRALVTTGQIPLPGLRDMQGGAVWAFDPSRFASSQDRVRASMVGNPVSVLMTPDGESSYLALRASDQLVPLQWLASGTVRRQDPIATCREPEQLELVRRGRHAIVRCNEGKALQVFNLHDRTLVRTIPLNTRAADMAVSPDGEQVVVALPGEGTGMAALVDLKTFQLNFLPLGAEPTRLRLTPDGTAALLLSDRSKVAWVLQ